MPAGNISNGTLDENEWIGIWNASRNISESDLIMDDIGHLINGNAFKVQET